MSHGIRSTPYAFLALLLICGVAAIGADAPKAAAPASWSMNATIIEACSCPMFCQCYFNSEPAGHSMEGHEGMAGAEHYCKFNNAYRVNKGSYGGVKLDGAKFWVAGDLGAEFSGGEMEWAVVTFDPSVTKEQRDGIAAIVGHVYPVKWKSFAVAADAPIAWTASKDAAHASLDGGKAAEVSLKRFAGNTDQPVVIQNLKYWGTKRNSGFTLMPNEVEAYRAGDKAFEYKGTNGFMITIDINDKDVMAADGAKD
ncbi:MAG TPA: DUF1326 domain-containing protein [Candidatus Eisenbacteria bacterium]